MKNKLSLIILAVPLLCAAVRGEEFKGRIERFDPAFDKLLATDAKIEKLADGVTWAEGPVWFDGGLVFSDVPKNVIYRWQEGWDNKRVFLQPSGQMTAAPGFREPGSNGLTVDRQGRLLLCQCGERRIGRWEPEHGYTTIAERYDGKRFNTPNDLVVKRNGDIYFTDPPYGFSEGNDSKLREIPWHGVYRVATDGKVTLLAKDIAYANGIAFSPDEKTLYVGSTENGHAHIQAFDVQADGTLANERLFFNAQPLSRPDLPGSCDGMKVDRDGNVWTSGPGGILVITPAGKLIGRLNTGVSAANCNWGNDGGTLYLTATHWLLRVRTLTKGNGW